MTSSGSHAEMAGNVQLLVFRLDERLHALPLTQVDRVIRSVDATPLPNAPEVVLGLIDLQGEIVPLINIRRRLGLEYGEIAVDDQFIIAKTSQRTVALLVDSVMGIVARPAADILAAQKILPGLHQIKGVIQLDVGLTLIHDLSRFLSLEEEHALNQAITMELSHEA